MRDNKLYSNFVTKDRHRGCHSKDLNVISNRDYTSVHNFT